MNGYALIKPDCKSVFAAHIEDYINQHRALGYVFSPETQCLNQFDDFCCEQDIKEIAISDELIKLWSSKRKHESTATHKLRIRCIRAFCVYLYNKGISAPITFHPLPREESGFTPYIFSEHEISDLFHAVDSIKSSPNASPIRHLVIPILFRMIYSCGLRVNEATMLRKDDLNLTDRTVNLLNTKGQHDRIVVMSDSMHKICAKYVTIPEITGFDSPYLFPSNDHEHYSTCHIYKLFRDFLFAAGIPHRGRGKGPRLHDLRHTFAVHVLSKWQREGKDLYVCLPILARYMGHSCLSSTEKYLRLVPESYDEVTGSFEQTFPNIFPEVSNENK